MFISPTLFIYDSVYRPGHKTRHVYRPMSYLHPPQEVLQGKVVDNVTGEPLPLVHIELFSAMDTISTRTDHDGLFVERLPKQIVSLSADLEGYLTYRNQVDLTKGMVDLEIRLERMQQKP